MSFKDLKLLKIKMSEKAVQELAEAIEGPAKPIPALERLFRTKTIFDKGKQ